MHVRYDPEVDAAYLTVGREVQAGEAVAQVSEIRNPHGVGEIILDFDADGHLVGVEVLQASKLLRSDDLDRAQRISDESL
ncbi:DUF2283 domain-containing protein [Microbacterium sp. p3-SID336]|uniref:DUF2283 domain-containing protein n=1 Tax=Microbacterium sp. p3-SID336 TaxID=2916212 RepID=UPI0021A87684|nr:DUF2283 domain-containing protein [Microbacterium sp. p3-SID336]MCT1479382.1 DUF2283 domain-containing protein [Microbacterium sp. p3-SID336]